MLWSLCRQSSPLIGSGEPQKITNLQKAEYDTQNPPDLEPCLDLQHLPISPPNGSEPGAGPLEMLPALSGPSCITFAVAPWYVGL